MITLDRLQQIIPPDQALANKALSVALQQIAGISNNPLPTMAAVISQLETTKDLPLVQGLSQPVPADVAAFYTSTFNQGSYSTAQTNIVNSIGVPSGIGYVDPIVGAIGNIATMNVSGLQITYEIMANVVAGEYDFPNPNPPYTNLIEIPPGTPYAGIYPDADNCFNTALIPGAEANIANLIVSYPTQTTSMHNGWFGMGNQFANEQYSQYQANINFAQQTTNQQGSIFGFVYSLPTYATDTADGGMAQYLEGVADLSSFTGQCIVGALREGRNAVALRNAGVTTNNTIPANPIPAIPTANLIPSTYTTAEAANISSPTTQPTYFKGTVLVPPAARPAPDPTIRLSATPPAVANDGTSTVKVTWSSTNAVSFSLTSNGTALNTTALSGSTTLGPWTVSNPLGTINLLATVTNSVGKTATATATIGGQAVANGPNYASLNILKRTGTAGTTAAWWSITGIPVESLFAQVFWIPPTSGPILPYIQIYGSDGLQMGADGTYTWNGTLSSPGTYYVVVVFKNFPNNIIIRQPAPVVAISSDNTGQFWGTLGIYQQITADPAIGKQILINQPIIIT